MISVAELHALLERIATPLPPCGVPLAEAGGLVLAQRLLSDVDQPAFDRSAMDGYAVVAGAEPGRFRLLGAILPGEAAPATSPGRGEAWRVYTGSALPPGVRVVMQEEVVVQGEGEVEITQIGGSDHVRRRGSAARRGDLLLPAGGVLSAAHLAIAASVGVVRPVVIPAPRVVHLTTGSEVVSPEQVPGPGQIRDTNGPLIEALLREMGVAAPVRRHAGESVEEGLAQLREAGEAQADLLILSGGASVGDFDGSAVLLQALGFTLICHKVNVRPGKPLLVGVRGRQIAFGLPGNPVSHFVTFHLFVRRVVEAMMGRPRSLSKTAVLEAGAMLFANPRETYWPARLRATERGWAVTPLPWLDSGHLGALAGVDVLLRLPGEVAPPRVGDRVEFLCCFHEDPTLFTS